MEFFSILVVLFQVHEDLLAVQSISHTLCLSSLHKCSIGLRSGDWEGQLENTLIRFWVIQFSTSCRMQIVYVSCWIMFTLLFIKIYLYIVAQIQTYVHNRQNQEIHLKIFFCLVNMFNLEIFKKCLTKYFSEGSVGCIEIKFFYYYRSVWQKSGWYVVIYTFYNYIWECKVGSFFWSKAYKRGVCSYESYESYPFYLSTIFQYVTHSADKKC